jgi:hypothetical protein
MVCHGMIEEKYFKKLLTIQPEKKTTDPADGSNRPCILG